ncbi:MAG: carbonic anhydrase family protein [Betaproteobacteria bacterium]
MRPRNFAVILILVAATFPALSLAAWQIVATEQGKHVEIDRDSISIASGGQTMAKGRIVLDRPIVDPRTSVSYRTIEVLNRFDCEERTHATLKRSYYKDDGELLRQEEVKSPFDMPVRSGTPDDKLLREACRPKGVGSSTGTASQVVEKAGEAAAGLRQLNEALIEKEVKKDAQRLTARARGNLSGRYGMVERQPKQAIAVPANNVGWSYEGNSGPDNWSKLRPEYAVCASGRRQSPIDIRDGFAVDLEPIQFSYRPSSFRVVDSGKSLLVLTYGGGLSLLGKSYVLTQIQFHRPSEFSVAGKNFPMDAQLTHRAEDGQLAVVTVLLEKGAENPIIQMALNNLPLEKGGDVVAPGQNIDVERLLPSSQRYFAFMGSMTVPPCSENVLWLVLKQPQQISPEQLDIFERLYKPNARPLQPVWGRIVKESR